ncbi:MAG: glucosamine-6-phosphate deaminase [Defluviitaleaceae bacterium]|nr:glucosamine-6-phosphate deaminase [Defluviitaleaceae bacterium]
MIVYENFKIIITENYEELSKKTADLIAEQINKKPNSVLGLATGNSPLGTYKFLRGKNLDFSKVTIFNLDEYYPILKSNNQSYDYYMRENLFSHINIDKNNIYIPNGEATDPNIEAEEYENKIESKGMIDLQLIGIGVNGHIGFSEPCDYFPKYTHYTELADLTIEINSKNFENINEMPKNAITMGIGTIFKAKEILLIASGENKNEIIEKTIFEKITPQIPSSILQLHPNVTIILDELSSVNLLNRNLFF